MQLKEKFIFETRFFSPRKLKRDFIDYCVDLQKVESGILTWGDKTGFSFNELLEISLKENTSLKERIQKAAVICVAHAEYEYDPDYSHIVSYMINRLKLNSSIFSIQVSREKLLNTAEHLLREILLPNDAGLIIDFEQSVLPLVFDKGVKKPVFSAARFYFYR